MESLVNAASEFLAALFARLGYVGRPRRRANIRDELQLLDQLRDSPEFGPSSRASGFLVDHVTNEVARYSGVELKRKRKIPWSSVILALLIGLPLAFWTYKLNQDGFSWFSILPGLMAALLLLAVLGMLFGDAGSSEESDAPDTATPSV